MFRAGSFKAQHLLRIFLPLCAALLPGLWLATLRADTQPPADTLLEAYAALPALTDLQISPDGQRIAALQPVGQLLGLTIIDLNSQRSNIALAADPERYQINFCRWANEIRLVCQVRTVARVARGGKNQTLFQSTASIAVDHDGGKLVRLSEGGPVLFGEFNRGGFISLLPHDRDHILMPLLDPKAIRALQDSVITSSISLWPEVWRVDINDGTKTRLLKARDGIAIWIADDDGVVRGGLGRRAIMRDGKGWRSVDIGSLGETPTPEPLGFAGLADRGDGVYLAANLGHDRRGVIEFDTRAGTTSRTVFRDDRFDFDGSVISRAGVLQALLTLDDQIRYIPISEDARALDTELRTAFGGQPAVPWTHDDAWQRFTVMHTLPDQPTTWYLYDRPARKLIRIGSEFPTLTAENLPVSTWTSYQARDGIHIPARLVLPATGARNLPTILMPHGGPIARDSGFNFMAAYLARRGYAVLQPQFRGSWGFGKTFMNAGEGQWGLKMQDDLLDGLEWLRSEGIAHQTKACTVGLSYGGYAALVTAYKTPDHIRCAVSYAPVTDLPTLVRDIRHFRMGRPGYGYAHLPVDADILAANSPLAHVARFKVPVLVLHGDRDTNVLVEQSRTLAAALQSAGKPHRYIEQEHADHFLGIRAHRREFLAETASFLDTHLGSAESR